MTRLAFALVAASASAAWADPAGAVKQLKSPDEAVRLAACAELEKAGPAAAKIAVSPLMSVFKNDESYDVRRAAAKALGAMGATAARSVVPTFVEVLKERDVSLYFAVAEAVAAFGPDAKSAVPPLLKAHGDNNKGIRDAADAALGKILPDAKSAVSAYTTALADMDRDVRSGAAAGLGRVGADAKSSVPALAKLIKDGDRQVRVAAIEALGAIGPAAAAALPALTEAAKDGGEQVVRKAADSAIAAIKAAK